MSAIQLHDANQGRLCQQLLDRINRLNGGGPDYGEEQSTTEATSDTLF